MRIISLNSYIKRVRFICKFLNYAKVDKADRVE